MYDVCTFGILLFCIEDSCHSRVAYFVHSLKMKKKTFRFLEILSEFRLSEWTVEPRTGRTSVYEICMEER